MATYTSEYPPAQNATYVKTTSTLSANYYQYFATDPTKSLIGAAEGTSWLATNSSPNRFHIDLGSAKKIRRIYYENYHGAGTQTNWGSRAFTVQGSNDATAFSTLTYATNTNWTDITTDISEFVQHVASNTTDPRYVILTNSTEYRYYAIKIATNWGGTYTSIRRFVLQTEDDPIGISMYPKIIMF